MLPDQVSNPGPLTYESGALPIALRGPALRSRVCHIKVDFTEKGCKIKMEELLPLKVCSMTLRSP